MKGTPTLSRRIYLSFLALYLVFITVAGLLVAGIVVSVSRNRLTARLREEQALVLDRINQVGEEQALNDLLTVSRVTLIAPDGSVIADNWARDPLENHAQRPEVQQAIATGVGQAVRYSQTTHSTAIYVSTRLADGRVLRVAAPEQVARQVAGGVIPWMVFGFLGLVIISLPLASKLSRSLMRPILKIDLDHPEDSLVFEETLPLVRRIAEQHRENQAQMEALKARRQELDTLLNGMHEGFIALDAHLKVILMNPSAQKMLGVEGDKARGQQMLAINRSEEMQRLLADLQQQGSAERVLKSGGRTFLLSASTVESGKGSVLLLSDQTEKAEGEAMRKSFTANVSHELRTPLTTICGYAEMLDQGMVKPEDVPQFHQVIYRESSRMLSLVEDILRLSKLDEGQARGRLEKVDLFEVAKRVCQSLELAADEQDVALHLTGETAFVMGDATLLDELCSNLIDNAIKYNQKDGKVEVSVTAGSQVVLLVKDTGIGIEDDHLDRVFERFYRTDKSRSKATGGTGLGLSIVKHAAEFHRARIQLASKPGQGTTVSVSFPPCQPEGQEG